MRKPKSRTTIKFKINRVDDADEDNDLNFVNNF